MDILELSIDELAGLYKTRQLSVREVVAAYLARIEAAEPSVRAFLRVFAEDAASRASELDERGYDGGLLYGVPVAV